MTTHTLDIIHRLLNGECSEADLKVLREDREAATILDIIQESGSLDIPQGLSQQQAWDRVATQLHPQTRVRLLRPLTWIVSAAAVVLVLALFLWPSDENQQSWSTAAGEHLYIELADGSRVTLNAGSHLSATGDWDDTRSVHLDGTAFFDVTSGAPFIVQTQLGEVQVLGTQFEVIASEEDYVVTCFEGAVSVSSLSTNPNIVTAGEGIRLVGQTWEQLDVQQDHPSWTEGITTFKEAPIREVLNAYERQFGVEIDYYQDDRKYTGAFPHDNADDALNMILLPMNLEIEAADDERIRLRILEE